MTTISLAVAFAAFVVGYVAGRVDTILATLRDQANSAPPSFFAKTNGPLRNTAGPVPAANIAIDERKVVSQIKTDSLQKVTDIQLGKQVVAEDDINASVNKLSQLKGK